MLASKSLVRLTVLVAIGCTLFQASAAGEGVDRRSLFTKQIKGCVGVMTIGGPASGWVLDAQKRWIITCQHVIGSREEADIVFPAYKDGRLIQERGYYLKTAPRFKATVLSADPKRDLCLLVVESLPDTAAALQLATDSGQPGDNLNLIGNPAASGAMWNYSIGTLRAVYQKKFTYKNTSHEVDALVGETQLPANPGDSGAAVFNDSGEVLGIHSGGTPDGIQLMATYIDVLEIKKLLDEPFKAVAKSKSFEDLLNAGNDSLLRNEADKAIEAYSKAIQLKPDHSDAWRCRASANIRKQAYDKAIEDCNQALRLDRSNARACNERAVCYGAKGDLKAALIDYNEAIRLNPKDAMFWAGRAWTYNGLKEYTKAIDDAGEAIKLKKDFALPYSERGLAFFRTQEYAKALADLDQAIVLNARDAQAWLYRGLCYKSLGNQEQAETNLRRAKELDPAVGRSSNE